MELFGYVFVLCILATVQCKHGKKVTLEELEHQVQYLMEAREADHNKIEDLERQASKDRQDIEKLTSQVKSLTNHDSLNSHSSRQVSISQGVAFTTCISAADIKNIGAHQTIVFDHAITNEGGAYHTTTGIFTAPVDGVYVFHVSLMTGGGSQLYFEIIQDGKFVDNMLTDGTGDSSWESSTELWVLRLARGSEVWIRAQFPGSLHGACHTMWSGFLLYETEM